MSPTSDAQQYLGFDYGTQRIGVAVGNALTGTARGLEVIRNAPTDWDRVAALMVEWRPAACIVGLPLNMDGSEQPLTLAARKFARALHGRFGCPTHTMDERLSSVAAREDLKSQRAGGRKRRIQPGEKDSEAARIILEDWLSQSTA